MTIEYYRVKMMEYNVWEEPVLCFASVEHTTAHGVKYVDIKPVDDFDESVGVGTFYIRDGERFINSFPAMLGTKNLYGRCDGYTSEYTDNKAYRNAAYLGCNVPNGNKVNWMAAIINWRKIYKVDMMTGEKVIE